MIHLLNVSRRSANCGITNHIGLKSEIDHSNISKFNFPRPTTQCRAFGRTLFKHYLKSRSSFTIANAQPESAKKEELQTNIEVASVSDIDESGKGKWRRDIRRILDESELKPETTKAVEAAKLKQQELSANKQRNQEKQDSGRVMVNPGHGEHEPDIYFPENLLAKLKPHQVEAIKFMWENVVSYGDHGTGCLLAHEMGLGKTFSTIGFLYMYFTNYHLLYETKPHEKPAVLLIVPTTVTQHWENELEKWLTAQERPIIFTMRTSDARERVTSLKQWHQEGGIMLTGYDMFRKMTDSKRKRFPSDLIATIMESLTDPGPDLVVIDEAHMIRNPNSAITMALKQIATTKRISLTGYPLQNHLIEYWCMMDFVKPNLLGTRQEFRNMFENPINNGRHADSTPEDVLLSKKRAYLLHKRLSPFVLRKDSTLLRQLLPNKREYVISCKVTPLQKELLAKYIQTNVPHLLGAFNVFSLIGNHPALLWRALDAEKRHQDISSLLAEDVTGDIEEDSEMKRIKYDLQWGQSLLLLNGVEDVGNSSKFMVLMQILRTAKKLKEKTLVFSKSIPTLDLIGKILSQEGFSYVRLDGSTPAQNRQALIDQFNTSDTLDAFVISTKAGGLGINLAGASRVVLFDLCWNPCHDIQAAVRVFRYGQTKETYVYRLQNEGTIESKMYKRQISKEALSKNVIDYAPTSRLYNANELGGLLQLEIPEETLEHLDSEDPVLNAVTQGCGQWIYKISDHETLLLPDENEHLDEADKIVAEKEYNVSKQLTGAQFSSRKIEKTMNTLKPRRYVELQDKGVTKTPVVDANVQTPKDIPNWIKTAAQERLNNWKYQQQAVNGPLELYAEVRNQLFSSVLTEVMPQTSLAVCRLVETPELVAFYQYIVTLEPLKMALMLGCKRFADDLKRKLHSTAQELYPEKKVILEFEIRSTPVPETCSYYERWSEAVKIKK